MSKFARRNKCLVLVKPPEVEKFESFDDVITDVENIMATEDEAKTSEATATSKPGRKPGGKKKISFV